MNTKTILLATVIAVATGQAIASSEYRMRIGIKEVSSDTTDVESWLTSVTKGDIENVGNPHSCTAWTPDPSTVFYGKTFLQSRTCQQDKSQEETTTKTNKVTNEKIVDVKTNLWSEDLAQQNNSNGTRLYTSCKEAKDDEPGSISGTYTLQSGSFYCDMTTDGGGWTAIGNVSANSSGGITPSRSINDKNLNYTEVFINDRGSSSDLGNSSVLDWDFNGFDIGKMAINFNGTWHNASGAFVNGCNLAPAKISRSNYKFIQPTSVCYENSNQISDCGTKVSVKVPSGGRIQAIGDVESIYGVCYSTNRVNYNYDIYVR